MTTQSNPREMLERLRKLAKYCEIGVADEDDIPTCLQAAATIERLNSELERKAEVVERVLAISLRADLKPETKVAIIKDKARGALRDDQPNESSRNKRESTRNNQDNCATTPEISDDRE